MNWKNVELREQTERHFVNERMYDWGEGNTPNENSLRKIWKTNSKASPLRAQAFGLEGLSPKARRDALLRQQ